MIVKIPAGYAHAGRFARVREQAGATVTVEVPKKRRINSARRVPAALVSVKREDLTAGERKALEKAGVQ